MPSPFFDGLGSTILDIHKEAEPATFKPKECGSPQPVEVIFSKRHQDIDIDGRPYGAPKPRAWFETGLIKPEFGDLIEIDGINYVIREVKEDGLELTELTLSEP